MVVLLVSVPHINILNASYLKSGRDDVVTLVCVLLSRWGINSWWQLPQCAALQSITLLRWDGKDTERWGRSRRDEGGPENADSSVSSAVPDGGHQPVRQAVLVEAKLSHRHRFTSRV